MLRFVKQVLFTVVPVLSFNPLNANSMNNQECKTRTKTINIKYNEPVFYPFNIKVNKCSRSCNDLNYPYAKLCVPDVVKNINAKVFNLMSLSNQTKHIECKCRLDASVC